jgi:hypothetical protein
MADETVVVPVVEVKKPWQSKTLWVNLIMAVAALFWPAAGDFIASHPEVAMVAFAAVNAVLRLVTKDKLQIS